MSKLIWDKASEHFYETGVSETALYLQKTDGKYDKGTAWNGITGVTESPSGADATDLYADNIKYLSLRAAETFGGTIEAYTYPDEFAECDGSKEIVPGVYAGQQSRKAFGLAYKTILGNDTAGNDFGYKLHLVYGATVNPSEKAYATVNDSPEAITFSWEFSTVPAEVAADGFKPTSLITIDSTKIDKEKLKTLEEKLYGTNDTEPTLPTPDEVFSLLGVAAA